MAKLNSRILVLVIGMHTPSENGMFLLFTHPMLTRYTSLLLLLFSRFILCRSLLTFFGREEDNDDYVPVCLPQLPESVSAGAEVVQSAVMKLAEHLKVSDCFRL